MQNISLTVVYHNSKVNLGCPRTSPGKTRNIDIKSSAKQKTIIATYQNHTRVFKICNHLVRKLPIKKNSVAQSNLCGKQTNIFTSNYHQPKP